MRIRAEKTEVRYLRPGDLYSDKPQEWWDNPKMSHAALYICLGQSDPKDTDNVYRIIRNPDQVTQYDPKLPPGMGY